MTGTRERRLPGRRSAPRPRAPLYGTTTGRLIEAHTQAAEPTLIRSVPCPVPAGRLSSWSGRCRARDRHLPSPLLGWIMPETVLITGATSGIGLETARRLATRDVHVLLHARTVEEGEHALEELVKTGTDPLRLKVAVADFIKLSEVRELDR